MTRSARPPREGLLEGRCVGEYEVGARLGAGGMGVVYEGRQPVIGKRVAIKVLLPHLSDDPDLTARFLAEARAVNAIGHRGIVDVFSFGTLDDGTHYFVMEYLDGIGFDRLLTERGPQPAWDVLGWTLEALDALEAAHSAGVVHRDVKPSNLFLVRDGHGNSYVKLLDFGIAKTGALRGQATPQTRVDAVIGTPDYMAPEQIRGEPVSARTDVYAMGCVMFELLTGRRPYVGENPMRTLFQHLEEPVPTVSSVLPDAPIELDELVGWAMQKDPEARAASAGELRRHVEAVRQLFAHHATRQVLPLPRRISTGAPAASDPNRRRSRRSLEVPPTVAAPVSVLTPLEPITRIAPGPTTVVAPATPPPPRPAAPQRATTLLVGVCATFALTGLGAWGWVAISSGAAKIAAAPPHVDPPSPPATALAGPAVPLPELPEAPLLDVPERLDDEAPVAVARERAHPGMRFEARPRASGPTDAELEGRLARLGRKLGAREDRLEGPDPIMRALLEHAAAQLKAAASSADRAKVAAMLAELDQQLEEP